MSTNSADDKLVGKRVRKIREALGMSQIEFAGWLQHSRSVVSRIESGKRTLRPSEIVEICKQCQVSSEWVLGLRDGAWPS
jgi:ribosome-binding protein aMBF1 (putative translation factor)